MLGPISGSEAERLAAPGCDTAQMEGNEGGSRHGQIGYAAQRCQSLPYAETGDRLGLPVVLVHAYVESWRYFDDVLRRLPASIHGYVPKQRGHGDADRPEGGYRLEDFAADIVAFMDVMAIERAVLVGSSSGGLVAQLVASTHVGRVCALVLISSPTALADKPVVSAMWKEISSLSDPIDRSFVENFVRSTCPESVPDDVIDALTDESLKAPARTWKETLRGLIDADAPVALEQITAPTLLISGERDGFVSHDQEALLRRIPQAEQIVYDGVGHAVHPSRVVDHIVAFLHRHLPATTA
jgi:pimeloyl-ACP methyl ester carboxylesterase